MIYQNSAWRKETGMTLDPTGQPLEPIAKEKIFYQVCTDPEWDGEIIEIFDLEGVPSEVRTIADSLEIGKSFQFTGTTILVRKK